MYARLSTLQLLSIIEHSGSKKPPDFNIFCSKYALKVYNFNL